jgi:hypothetical protein
MFVIGVSDNFLVLNSFSGVYIVPTSLPLYFNIELSLGQNDQLTNIITYQTIPNNRGAYVGEHIQILFTNIKNP